MKKLIGLVLLIAGLAFMAYPFLEEGKQAKDTRSLEQALALINSGEPADPADLDNLPVSEEALENTIRLEIPSIGIDQLVLPETTAENLNLALTQIKPDQTPGEGNFTIAGHRGWRDGRHFSNLSKVKKGDRVILQANDKEYIYEVTGSEVIPPTAVDVLNDRPGKHELTLITCTVTGADRLAVKGKLIDE